MINFLFGISIMLNLLFIVITMLILNNKKCRNFFKEELEDEKAFKEFFNRNRIDF